MWRFHWQTLKDVLPSARSHGRINVSIDKDARDAVREGERHLLQPVGRSGLLISPILSRAPVLGAHPSLQLLQTLLHMRGHL